MISIQQILALFLTLTMELSLAACGTEAAVQPDPETSSQVQETPEALDMPPAEELAVTEGTETYREFLLDNVLHAPEGDIH